ncbi:MAG TPA: acetate/propionate family kinase [Streptosporangiaceae bacterium]|jgi:acetate kinase|nr:acetate/propionate family kinase [Streptosporangiaceae bacterium]
MGRVTPDRVLVVNAGSSSLKLSLLGPASQILGSLNIDPWHGEGHTAEMSAFVAGLDGVGAVGHRVVHGGSQFRDAVLIDDDVLAAIESLTDLAPLHQPRALAGIRAAAALLPGVPAVACFDTAFHAGMPEAAATYALPADWRNRFGLRRYGFHGLSHSYASRRAAELASLPPGPRVVTCHLGSGASLAAVSAGRSVDTTMGFTPLEGLVMATRSGSVDPGMLVWLLQAGRLSVAQLGDGLESASGLAGLTGGSGDMREVEAAADGGRADARLALGVYVHRLRREIAAMAAAMNGLDALVFTGGVGEHDPALRAAAGAGLTFLGVAVDEESNKAARGDASISAPGSPVQTLVITAREDIEIAGQTRAVLRKGTSS